MSSGRRPKFFCPAMKRRIEWLELLGKRFELSGRTFMFERKPGP
jgi:hypothetical protein